MSWKLASLVQDMEPNRKLMQKYWWAQKNQWRMVRVAENKDDELTSGKRRK